MTREVQGVRWVKVLAGRPGCIPQGRPRGAQGRGVKFEGAVAAIGPEAAHGVWFEYEDAAGHGYAQVDFLWRHAGGAVIGEAKLTWRREAYVQLRRLYFPLLRVLLPGMGVGGVVICKNVTRDTPRDEVVGSLASALDRASKGSMIPVLHLPLVGA